MNFSEERELARQHYALVHEVDFHVELVDAHPVLEVAVEPVGLFDQERADAGMRLEMSDHFAEAGAARLLCRLDVDVFLRDREPLRRRVRRRMN